MTRRLTTNYAKNYCYWTLIVKVIVENVVTCFFGDTVYVHGETFVLYNHRCFFGKDWTADNCKLQHD